MPDLVLEPVQIVAITLFVSIVLFEALLPFREYRHRLRHLGKNGVFAVCNTVILALFGAILNVAAFVWIAENHIGFLNFFEMPFWMAALIASILFDAWLYVWHRLNHVIPFFWRFHQVHHSDLEMDFSTALRFHPGEILLSSIVNIAVFAILGISIEYLVIYKIVFNINVLWHHSNVALSEKWDRLLRLVLVSPNMHRVHHSMRVKETNSNYSSVLSIWDRLFGSYRFSDPKKIVFGLDYDRGAEDQTIARLLSRPFKNKNDR
jgi:sterol desaturase/sphingolipid hydroxylase (fatty acid hydroxylase superfamily)